MPLRNKEFFKNQKMVIQLSLNKDYHRISDQNYGAKNGEGSGWVDLVQYIKISVISNFAKRLNSVPCKILKMLNNGPEFKYSSIL